MDENNYQTGSIDALDRVMQELLSSPKFKEGVKILLKSLDPQSTPQLVRTLLWRDPELFLSFAGVAPEFLNVFLLGGKELLMQMDKLPPSLLVEFAASFIDKIEGEFLGELICDAISLYLQMKALNNESLINSLNCFHEDLKEGLGKDGGGVYALFLPLLKPLIKSQIANLAKEAKNEKSETSLFIKGLSETIKDAVKENPEFISHIYKPLTDPFISGKNFVDEPVKAEINKKSTAVKAPIKSKAKTKTAPPSNNVAKSKPKAKKKEK